MKKERKTRQKKLTPADFKRMWGEDGPYSQVRLCEETRILDDSVSRVFLVVEAEINPFTFEYVQSHRDRFTTDEPVLQLLESAEYRDKFGYVVSAGEVELEDEASWQFARTQADMTIATLIRMHHFVMEDFNLKHGGSFGILEDAHDADRFVWNPKKGAVEKADDELWDSHTRIGAPAGIRDNKMRFYFAFAFTAHVDFSNALARTFAKTLQSTVARLGAEVEDIRTYQEHALLTALLPFAVAPASFAEAVLDECNAAAAKPFLQKDYLVTNVEKPTPMEIAAFLKQLPLNRDIKMNP